MFTLLSFRSNVRVVEGVRIIGGHEWVLKSLGTGEENEGQVAWNEAMSFLSRVRLGVERLSGRALAGIPAFSRASQISVNEGCADML